MPRTSIHALDDLPVSPEQIKHDLELTRWLSMAEAVMIEITCWGMRRQETHAVLRKCSPVSVHKNMPPVAVLRQGRGVIGNAAAIVERAVEELLIK